MRGYIIYFSQRVPDSLFPRIAKLAIEVQRAFATETNTLTLAATLT